MIPVVKLENNSKDKASERKANMSLVKRLIDKIDKKKDEKDQIKVRDIFDPLWEVVADGDIDAQDFDLLVEAVRELIAYGIPLINVPWVPAVLESTTFDSWAVPLLQSFADEIVSFCFVRFNIPLPPDGE
jgi:hypothetical protein